MKRDLFLLLALLIMDVVGILICIYAGVVSYIGWLLVLGAGVLLISVSVTSFWLMGEPL